MKKIQIAILVVTLSIISIKSQEFNEYRLIKRTISVLPVVFFTDNEKYNYLDILINQSMKSSFLENFAGIQFSDDKEKESIKDSIEFAKMYAEKKETEFVVYGSLTVSATFVTLNLKCYDSLKEIVIDSIVVKEKLENDPFVKMKNRIYDFSQSIKTKIFSYNIELVTMLSSKQLTPFKKKIINNLIDQNSNKYWYYTINTQEEKKVILVPFLKNSVIFICYEDENFIVELSDLKIEGKSYIKVAEINDMPTITRNFKIKLSNGRIINYDYKQKTSYEAVVKVIGDSSKERKDSIYFDNALLGTTSGIFGYSFKIGFGLPFKSNLSNSLYLIASYGIKAINLSEIDNKINFESPNHKFYIGAGFEHLFYFKKNKNISMSLGIESGFETYLLQVFITADKVYNLNRPIIGVPAVNILMPFGIIFFANKKYNLLISAEPVIRFSMSYFVYQGRVWIIYSDYLRGVGMDLFRWRVDRNLTIDLFLYDMPILIAWRIRL